MDVKIGKRDVDNVVTYVRNDSTCSSIQTYVHHEMTPEHEAELLRLVEQAVIAAVHIWAAK